MQEEIIEIAVLAIKRKLIDMGRGPNQSFRFFDLASVKGKFSGGYFEEALERLLQRGLIVRCVRRLGFFVVTEEGYLWLTR